MVIAILMLLAACEQKESTSSLVLEGKTMGTYWRVSLAGIKHVDATELNQAIQQQLDEDDHQLSTWKSDSVLSGFNRDTSMKPYPVSDDMADLISVALRIGRKTGGAMDITVGPLVNLWGFGPEKQPVKIPNAAQILAARSITGLQYLHLSEGIAGATLQKSLPQLYVDLSTLGEGYATDHLARLMERYGFTDYLVSVGGAVLSRGHNAQGHPWRVAIQKPTDRENAVEAMVDLQGHGISTSGSYRNYYEIDGKRVSHIIDPATGEPVQHKLVSATVIATTALEADGWDTGLMVLGEKKAQELALREGLAVYLISKKGEDFTVWMSPQFAAFLTQQKE